MHEKPQCWQQPNCDVLAVFSYANTTADWSLLSLATELNKHAQAVTIDREVGNCSAGYKLS